MKKLLLALAVISAFTLSAQKQGNIWYFGDHAGLDFNTTPPTPLLNGQTDFPPPNGWNEGTSTISDNSGALLFYTNGMRIWNRLGQVMQNGDSLMGHASSTEAGIIVPLPGSNHLFYVFTTDGSENHFMNGLRYNIVDMCEGNNDGEVVSGAKNILLLDSVAEKLIAIRHANGADYWIITHGLNTDAFYSFRLTSNGIMDTVVSHTGTPDPQGWGGQMIASPNGQKIAYVIPNAQQFGKTLLLAFNASTGVVSNEQTLSSGEREWGTSFSPDNSKLYFSTGGIGKLFEYNLNAGNLTDIIASKTYIIPTGPDSWRHHQLGPDGKIYISRVGKTYLSVIEFPDSLYPACNYIDSAIYLGGQRASQGLPNFVTNYRYSNTTVQCPTGFAKVEKEKLLLAVYPNPALESLQIELPANMLCNLTITDVNGKLVFSAKQAYNLLQVSCAHFAPGLYIIKAATDNNSVTCKFIKQ